MSSSTPAEGFTRHAPGPRRELVPGEIAVSALAHGEIAAAVYEFAAGTEVGPDRHGRLEIGYVLAGELRDEYATYPAGTLFTAAAGTVHHPRTDTGATVLIINTGPAV